MKELIIKVDNITYSYKSHAPELHDVTAIKDITVEVSRGEFIVVLGRNGSGKSTLARHLNALLVPDKGYVLIKNMNTADEKYTWEIRNTAGMVFQNPDNQIVGTIVEEDVAFGPENLGIPPAEIRKRVDEALETVGMKDYAKNAPHLLSGGQKQRVAIAGILAMRPGCIILDEATSMLDPVGRKEVLKVLRQLNKKEGITVIHITHHMDEASIADRVFVMEKGSVVLQGKPSEVFENVKRIKDMGLDVPQVTELFYELAKEGLNMPTNILTVEEAANWIISNLKA